MQIKSQTFFEEVKDKPTITTRLFAPTGRFSLA